MITMETVSRDPAIPQGAIEDHPEGNLGGEDPLLEPAIEGAYIRISEAEAISNGEGFYSLCFLSGRQNVHIEKDGFRYFFPSNDALIPLSSPIWQEFSASGVVNFGLGAGPITLPFSLRDQDVHMLGALVDIAPASPVIRLFKWGATLVRKSHLRRGYAFRD